MNTPEIRTPTHKLLLCKIKVTDPTHIFLELKNGKREEAIPLESFIAQINEFLPDSRLELHTISN